MKLIASTYETEWEIYRRFNNEAGIWEQVIALRHIVYNGDSPLSLSYGRGNGIKGGVTRRNFEDKLPLGRLYVQGGERNIDPEKYKNKALLLPDYFDPIGFDGEYLDNEEGYDETKAKKYRIDMGRQSVVLKNMPKNYSEQMIDCTDIYPQRIGTVTKVIYSKVGETENYDIIDMTIPDALNYSSYKIDKIHIVFQSGMLAGKDFDVRLYTHTTRDIVTSELKKERRFQLVKEEIDGIYMPNRDSGYVPKVGDKYIVLGINTPDAYICDNDSRTGASWEMLRKALKYFHENAKPKFTFKGELDRLWVCENRELAREKIRVGGIISFTDENFQKYPVLIRITSVKQNLNTLDDIEIELSNETWRRDKYLTFNSQGQITNFAPTSSLYQTQSTAVRLNRRQAQLLRDVQKEIEKLSEKVDVLNGLLNVPTEEPTDDPTEGSEYEPIIDPTGGLIETTFP